ncbi:Transthyretin-like family protein [Ancylostoma caninum]|uniref:Transthyretin-like family protein n=1 Tax=Ancylostoma caninum TaxID=29170 RepID=A0A368G7C8_ANCCA|nr:Transthyretin-like family protein [Ancylostoma caninum]
MTFLFINFPYSISVSSVSDVPLAQGFSNSEGRFNVSGSKREVSTIEPYLSIFHRCNHDGVSAYFMQSATESPLCYKHFWIAIPKNFVVQGATPTKVFNIGRINLAGEFSGESTDCIN